MNRRDIIGLIAVGAALLLGAGVGLVATSPARASLAGIALACSVAGLFLARDRVLIAAVYASLIPLESLGFTGLSGWPMKVIGVALCVFALLHLGKSEIAMRSLDVGSIALLCILLASWAVGGYHPFGKQELGSLLMVMVGSRLVLGLVQSNDDFLRFLNLTGITFGVYGVWGALRFWLEAADQTLSVDTLRMSAFCEPNYFSVYMVLGLNACVASYFCARKRTHKWITAASSIGCLVGALCTLSRVGSALLVLSFIYYLSFHRGRLRQRQVLIVLLGVALIAFSTVGAKAVGWINERFLLIPQDTSIKGRIWAAEAGLGMIADNPVLGIGLGRFADSFASYSPPETRYVQSMVAHNSFVEVAAETGLVGLSVFLVVNLILLQKVGLLLRRRHQSEAERAIRAFFCASMLAIWAASFVLNMQFNKIFWLSAFGLSQYVRVAGRQHGPRSHSPE